MVESCDRIYPSTHKKSPSIDYDITRGGFTARKPMVFQRRSCSFKNDTLPSGLSDVKVNPGSSKASNFMIFMDHHTSENHQVCQDIRISFISLLPKFQGFKLSQLVPHLSESDSCDGLSWKSAAGRPQTCRFEMTPGQPIMLSMAHLFAKSIRYPPKV